MTLGLRKTAFRFESQFETFSTGAVHLYLSLFQHFFFLGEAVMKRHYWMSGKYYQFINKAMVPTNYLFDFQAMLYTRSSFVICCLMSNHITAY